MSRGRLQGADAKGPTLRDQDLGAEFEVKEAKVEGADVKCPSSRMPRSRGRY